MHKVLITGAGRMGALIACLLLASNEYQIVIVDEQFNGLDINRVKKAFPQLVMLTLNVSNKSAMIACLKKYNFSAVISSLPFYLNTKIAEIAKASNLHYFDLTEDIHVTEAIQKISTAAKTAFVPQCGLAPGFIGIVAYDLFQQFEQVDSIKCRVGALPQYSNNSLHYALTWSTDGLINEYINSCIAIKNKEKVCLPALEDLETIDIDGEEYEAFNTSGGLGSLADICLGKVNFLNYKTMRFPGHCEKMRFLLDDLRLANDREMLKKILERSLPKTYQDIVLIYVTASGIQNKEYIEKTFFHKILPQEIAEINWSAIQIATASGICVVVDLVLQNPQQYQGFIYQEKFKLTDVLGNRFGNCFA